MQFPGIFALALAALGAVPVLAAPAVTKASDTAAVAISGGLLVSRATCSPDCVSGSCTYTGCACNTATGKCF